MRRKLATPVALVAAGVGFGGVFWFFGLNFLAFGLAIIVFVAVALGVYLMLDDRSEEQVELDNYREKTAVKVDETILRVREIAHLSEKIQDEITRQVLTKACRDVPILLNDIRDKSPDRLYSTASDIGMHIESLRQALRTYLEIQTNPDHFPNGPVRIERGHIAFRGFATFVADSIRLVNTRTIAEYEAHLDTVIRPELP